MTNPWWQDFGKAALVLTGLAVAIGYQDELRAAGRQVAVCLSEFADSLSQREELPEVSSAPEPVEEADPEVPEPPCRRTVTYIVVQCPSCRPVGQSCH